MNGLTDGSSDLHSFSKCMDYCFYLLVFVHFSLLFLITKKKRFIQELRTLVLVRKSMKSLELLICMNNNKIIFIPFYVFTVYTKKS